MPEERPADTALGARTIRPIGTLDEFGVPDRAGHKVVGEGSAQSRGHWRCRPAESHSITTLSDRCES